MTKALISVGVLSVLAASTYAANHYLVNKVAQDFPLIIEDVISSGKSSGVNIESIETEVVGNRITQDIVLHIEELTETENKQLLHLKHYGEVGLFGYAITGKVVLDKTQGLTHQFIQEVTDVNEDIRYKFTTFDQIAEVTGEAIFGQVTHDGEEISLGKVSFDLLGDQENYESNVNIASVDLRTSVEVVKSGQITVNYDKLSSNEKATMTIKDVMFTDGTGFELAFDSLQTEYGVKYIQDGEMVNNLAINGLHVVSPPYDLPQATFSLKSKFTGIDMEKVKQISNAVAIEDLQKSQQLVLEIAEAGMQLSEFEIKLNDSSLSGKGQLAPATYTGAVPSNLAPLLLSQMSAKFDLKIANQLLSNLNIPPEAVAVFLKDTGTAYEGEIEYKATKLLVNGVALN